MKLLRKILTWCVAAAALSCAGSALAADSDDLVLKGDAACTACHDDSDGPDLLAIGKTRHGTQADSRTPTCTSCHGASRAHLSHKGSGKPPKPDVTFGAKTVSSAEQRTDACQSCHAKDARHEQWQGSAHQTADVSCTACHKVHVAKDKVRSKATQTEVCFACHKQQRNLLNKPSHHPVNEGKMACSDCHNPHGSAGPKLVKRDSVVDTCYTCHMEKRGPFVHNHQPVNEDCSTCHEPHGTTASSLLKSRAPFLCQTCHTTHSAIQPAVASGTVANPGWWNGASISQGRGCLNCHTQIHGSNNPSTSLPSSQRFFR